LLLAGVPVHVVSQRLGHASPVVTMSVYAHVLPGSQREAANLFARLIREAKP
jgi:integrase